MNKPDEKTVRAARECPFCGNDVMVFTMDTGRQKAVCGICGIGLDLEVWNTRATLPEEANEALTKDTILSMAKKPVWTKHNGWGVLDWPETMNMISAKDARSKVSRTDAARP